MRILTNALLFAILTVTALPLTTNAQPTPATHTDASTPTTATIPSAVAHPSLAQDKQKATPPVSAHAAEAAPVPNPAAQPAADLDKTAKDMAELFSRHVSLMAYGFATMGVFAAILALFGVIAPIVATKAYRAEIKLKAAEMKEHERTLASLVEEGKKHCKSLAAMVEEQGASEKFTDDIIKAAQEKARNGSGAEVLWGKAILAQKNKKWEKARTFWTSILENEPRNDTALFGAAMACNELFRQRGRKAFDISLLQEGEQYLAQIPENKINAAVWNNWGTILVDQMEIETDVTRRAELSRQAEEKYRKGIGCNPSHADVWSNWGVLLVKQADSETNTTRKAKLYEQAQEKYRKATECKPNYSEAWSNWGLLLSNLVAKENNPVRKAELFRLAEKKYRKATECKPDFPITWYNWGILLAKQADSETDVTRKTELYQQAVKKLQTATKYDPRYARAWGQLSTVFLGLAQVATASEKDSLIQQAEEAASQAVSLEQFSSLYNFACCAAQRGDAATCIKRLEEAHAHGKLPEREHLEQDTDLDPVRDTPEFKAFMKKIFGEA